MKDIRKTAIAVALEAGSSLRALFGKDHDITNKGVIDLVTEADIRSEGIIIERIRKVFPGHPIISEEKNPNEERSSEYWLIDPLDGTVNFAHNFPWFAVSLAFVLRGEIKVGVVYNPMLDEIYWAEKGKGAYLGEEKIRVSPEGSFIRSLLATGFPYDVHNSAEEVLRFLKAVLIRAQGVRRAGSAALDMAQVAAGRFEGFFEIRLKPWDTAAGALLIREAGGRCTDFSGRRFDPFMEQVAATNGLIHDNLLSLLNCKCSRLQG